MNSEELKDLLSETMNAWSKLSTPSCVITYSGVDEIEVCNALRDRAPFEVRFDEYPFELLSIYTTLNQCGMVYYTGGIVYQAIMMAINAPYNLDAFFAFITLKEVMLLDSRSSLAFVQELFLHPDCVDVLCKFSKLLFSAQANDANDSRALEVARLWRTPEAIRNAVNAQRGKAGQAT